MKNKTNQKDFVSDFVNQRVQEQLVKNKSYSLTKEGAKLLNQHALAMYQLYIRF